MDSGGEEVAMASPPPPAAPAALEPVRVHNSVAGFGDLRPLPSDLDFISQAVPLDSQSANTVKGLVQESLPDAELVSLRHFANRKLWRDYVARRTAIEEDVPTHGPNAKLLWHATKEPHLILGTGLDTNAEGFDFRRLQHGEYGSGSYFAARAIYPVKIHPRRKNTDGTFTLILAEVACGAVDDMKNRCETGLKMPHEMRPGVLNHSVRGTENDVGPRHNLALCDGEQFVIYHFSQAYPHFVAVIQLPPVYIITNVKSGKVLNVSGASMNNGANVQQWGNPESAESQWRIARCNAGTDDADAVTITNVKSGKMLNVAGGSMDNGANVKQWDNPTSPHSQWKVDKV